MVTILRAEKITVSWLTGTTPQNCIPAPTIAGLRGLRTRSAWHGTCTAHVMPGLQSRTVWFRKTAAQNFQEAKENLISEIWCSVGWWDRAVMIGARLQLFDGIKAGISRRTRRAPAMASCACCLRFPGSGGAK
jgi:hypothetical protein